MSKSVDDIIAELESDGFVYVGLEDMGKYGWGGHLVTRGLFFQKTIEERKAEKETSK